MEKNVRERKRETENLLYIWDFIALFSVTVDRASRQKMRKDVENLNKSVNQGGITDICRHSIPQ
jgi:hypothetical protein